MIFSTSSAINPNDEIDILVGQKNPFGNACGLVATKLDGKLFAIVGPMRMDYEMSVGLLKVIKSL